jgi:hypothetical protein
VKAKRSGASLEAPPLPQVSRIAAANNKTPSSAPAFESGEWFPRRTMLISTGRKTNSAEEYLTEVLRLGGSPGATSVANLPATVLDP